MGPSAYRVAGIAQAIRDLGHGVEDWGDVALPDLKPLTCPNPAVHSLAEGEQVTGAGVGVQRERRHERARPDLDAADRATLDVTADGTDWHVQAGQSAHSVEAGRFYELRGEPVLHGSGEGFETEPEVLRERAALQAPMPVASLAPILFQHPFRNQDMMIVSRTHLCNKTGLVGIVLGATMVSCDETLTIGASTIWRRLSLGRYSAGGLTTPQTPREWQQIQRLLDGVVAYLPSPLERPTIMGSLTLPICGPSPSQRRISLRSACADSPPRV